MNNKKAVIYGGGNIGRGFVGQLFYLSGYETVFVDVADWLVDSLNREKGYNIVVIDNDKKSNSVSKMYVPLMEKTWMLQLQKLPNVKLWPRP